MFWCARWRFFRKNLKNLGAEEFRERSEGQQGLGYEVCALRRKVDNFCNVFGESSLVLRLGREQICVMTGISDTNATFFEVSGRGVVSRKRAAEALRDRIGAGAVVATDKATAYIDVLCDLKVASHESYDSRDRSEGTINPREIGAAMPSNIPATTIRIEPEVKREASAILDELGLSMSTAMNMFLRAVIREGGMPFEMKVNKTNE